jgi:hypothetical protein
MTGIDSDHRYYEKGENEGLEWKFNTFSYHIHSTKKNGTCLPVVMRFSNHRVKEPQYMEEASPLLQLSSIINALVPTASGTGSTV